MRILILSAFLLNSLFAIEYYAKLEPVNNYVIKSSVSGKIVYTNDKIEGYKANNTLVVKIDSKVHEIELKESKNKLNSLNEMLEIEQMNYGRLSKISSRSAFEKDNQKIKVLNLKSQRSDLLIKIANLEDIVKNKRLVEKDTYIYNIVVKKGDYVNPGTILYEAKDLSRAKVEIFVPISEVESLEKKTLFINGVKSELKVDKVYKVADAKHISSYKVEIIIPEVKSFSKLVKIEFK